MGLFSPNVQIYLKRLPVNFFHDNVTFKYMANVKKVHRPLTISKFSKEGKGKKGKGVGYHVDGGT